MSELKPQGNYVFGLDIGTRSIVGSVGYREGDVFRVVAQVIKEHETRSMIDGQIHDIGQVGHTINFVKKQLEKKTGVKLEDVCIAAAGRVLRTVEANVSWELEKETVITSEEIAGLMSMAVEKAYEKFNETNDSDVKFYCVGNSVVRYYMNGYQIGNLENHKAKTIGEDIIATFLPDDVVDGLYRAVEIAGLRVVNMTLEPIAAIEVAIPEMYRMLNIALIDVGAGTSDICITKDGCIVAYGMIPIAGDCLTEIVAKEYLVDFATAENIKRGISVSDNVEYRDIIGLPQRVTKADVLKLLDSQIEIMAKQVAEKIKELNGGKSVSAVFIVGGGGKIAGYTDKVAKELDIVPERVALRGEEVMQKVIFDEDTTKDSLLVTPIGICLNYYEQSNNFIYVSFNDERIKIYDNGNLAIVDAAMHADFPNESLFPQRGKAISYSVNGIKKIQRGELGEPAIIKLNGEETDIHASIRANDVITVIESTAGKEASLVLAKIPEFKESLIVYVNGSKILLPKFAKVNNEIKTQYYDVQDGDVIEMLDFYTVSQVKEFMDVVLDDNMTVIVNNEEATEDTKIYENFNIKWVLKSEVVPSMKPQALNSDKAVEDSFENLPDSTEEEIEQSHYEREVNFDGTEADEEKMSLDEKTAKEEAPEEAPKPPRAIGIIVNARPVTLTGKAEYVFADIFDFIDFDHTTVGGKNLITTIDDRPAEYMEIIHEGAVVEVYWEQ